MIRDSYSSKSARFAASLRWRGMSSGSQWLSFISQAHLAVPVVGQMPHDFFPNEGKDFPSDNAHSEGRAVRNLSR